jgi:streptomycin 6-kinase
MLEDAHIPTEEMLRICGDVARRLHAAGPAPSVFERFGVSREISNWLSLLADEPELQAELRAVLADRSDDVLIHGDLHARNILRDGDAWKVIDPHAIRADRHAEIQPLLEASLHFAVDRASDHDLACRWLRAYTTAAAMDPHRTRRFTVLRALSEARLIDRNPAPDQASTRWAAGLYRLAEALR